MCPHVLWDEKAKQYRMWYSAGEQYEPNAIGYATSSDGVNWTKYKDNPIFAADPRNPWEQHKVTACQVIPAGDWHLMFYIGFRDENRAQIGLARSRDGITGWQRHPANPIIFPVAGAWDADACYKPFAIFDRGATAGCSGTTAAEETSSRSASPRTPATTWASRRNERAHRPSHLLTSGGIGQDLWS